MKADAGACTEGFWSSVLQVDWEAEASGSCISLLVPLSCSPVLHCRVAGLLLCSPGTHGALAVQRTPSWLPSTAQPCCTWGPCSTALLGRLCAGCVCQQVAAQCRTKSQDRAGMSPAPAGRAQDGCSRALAWHTQLPAFPERGCVLTACWLQGGSAAHIPLTTSVTLCSGALISK